LAAAFGGGTNMISTLREAVPKYASAQPLDFLASTKNASFSNWKLLVFHPEFPDGHQLRLRFCSIFATKSVSKSSAIPKRLIYGQALKDKRRKGAIRNKKSAVGPVVGHNHRNVFQIIA